MTSEVNILLDTASVALAAEDYENAWRNYLLASAKGSPYAEISLAVMHSFGLGRHANAKAAEEKLLKVIDTASFERKARALASHNLSTLYYTGGINLEPEPNKGFIYEKMAGVLGFPQ